MSKEEKLITIEELRLIELRGFLMGLDFKGVNNIYCENFISTIDKILDKNNEEIRSSKYKLK